MTKVQAIRQLLEERGSPVSWDYIYDNIERFYPAAKISREWKAGIRGTLYREIRNGRNFKRVTYGLFALRDYEEAEMIENEVEDSVDKESLLREAQAYISTKPSHIISALPRRMRVENNSQKKRVAKLEDDSCQICGWSMEYVNSKGKTVRSITIDHVIDKAKGTGEELQNIWALCPNCHYKKTLKVIIVDIENEKVLENGKQVTLHHNHHLDWQPKTQEP